MKRPFQDLRDAAVEVAEGLSLSLDTQFCIASEGYEFDKYAFHIQQLGLPAELAMEFTLEVSGDVIDRHFEGAP